MQVLRTGLFHPGKQHSWQVAAALSAAECLGWYATAIYNDPARFPYALARVIPGSLGQRLRTRLARRSSRFIDNQEVRHLPALEWAELAAAQLDWRTLSSAFNATGNRKFQHHVLRLLHREPVERLWGYDTSCRIVFEAAAVQGTIRILDQSIAHMAGLRMRLLADRERFPDLVAATDIPTDADCQRSTAEVKAASHVLVGCDYAASLARQFGAPDDRVHVCPYGYEEANFPTEHVIPANLGTLPVRFVFVGTVSARKGFHLMARVFSRISPRLATLTAIGPSSVSSEALAANLGNIEYRPAVPNAELQKLLASSHCFLFPSLHEGGGIVLYEAAACGLGIVQSANCGDGVRDGPLGRNGIVLQETTAQTLQAAIEEIIARPAILRDWSAASWAMRHERTWSAYRRRIVELLPRLV